MPVAQNLILRAVAGAAQGEVYTLKPGARVVIGRGQDATLRIDDRTVSRQHAELRWDGVRAALRDLGSLAGTLVDGRFVSELALTPGQRIQMGETTLLIEVQQAKSRISETEDQRGERLVASPREPVEPGATPLVESGERDDATQHYTLPELTLTAILAHLDEALAVAPVEAPAEGSLLAALSTVAAPRTDVRLYAIVDGAQAFEIAFTARLMGRRLWTLFSGDLAVNLSHVGPCLIELDNPAGFLALWVKEIGKYAGVLIQTNQSLDDLYRHLRKIFVVADESGQEYFFRYYDPRVLRTFLPTCTPAELDEFFGPVVKWIAEDERGTAFVVSARDGAKLVQISVKAAIEAA